MDWLKETFTYPPENLLTYGIYHPSLVALSVVIAIFTSSMALHMASQARRSQNRKQRAITIMTGSFAQGGGVWAMHFIGMLAFDLCTPVDYNLGLTLASMVPSVAASVIALQLNSRNDVKLRELMTGGVLMGAGIGCMHYIGMAGMEMAPALRYDPFMFAVSVLVAVCLAYVALWTRNALQRQTAIKLSTSGCDIAGGVVMGVAIAGMHYTGMSAARFVPPMGFEAVPDSENQATLLATGVSLFTIIIICLVVAVDLLLNYRRVSQEATSNERRLKAILQTAVDGIVTVNRRGIIIGANQATETILGWPEKDLLGQSIKTLIPETSPEDTIDDIEDFLENHIHSLLGVRRESEAQHRDGSIIPIRLAVGHVKLPQESLFVGFITDIREQLKMERNLKENEARFRTLIGNIPGAAYRCLHNKHWEMIFISDAVAEITGYPASDFILPNPVRHFSELIHPEDRDTIVASSSVRRFNIEYRIFDSEGQIRWIQDNGGAITDDEGNTIWLDGFMMDITQRKKLDLELISAKVKSEQAAMSRSAFLANMSHEIRTPMNAIIGFSDILMTTELNNEQNKYLTTLRGSARSLLHLLDDILDSAKLDKGKMTLEILDFSLPELVDSVVSTLWIQARNKGLTLSMNLSSQLKNYYRGSPDRIRQILMNLVGNALKFTEHGSVTVDVYPLQGDWVQFRITDTGIGIEAERLNAIFDPFTQADSSMDRRFGGTGLGTTISKQLVELMKGEISVTSNIGVGSCFQFKLPLPAGESPLQSHDNSTIEMPKLNILVADDVPQNVTLLQLILENSGHQVTCVQDGTQAVDAVIDQAFDLVLMDVQMPNLDGLSASRQIRALPKHQNVPIIAMTASVLEEDKRAAREAGMNGFCSKPVDVLHLHREMARVLKLGQLEIKSTRKKTVSDSALFNPEKGLQLWGNINTYRKELYLFLNQFETSQHELHRLLEQSKFSALASEAHSLRGLCGNLAMDAFVPVLSQLEQGSRKQVFQTCCNSISKLKPMLIRLRSELENQPVHEAPSGSQPDPVTPCNWTELKAAVASLKASAQRNQCDDDALDLLNAANHHLRGHTLTALDNALNDFDFPAALEHLEQLEQQIAEDSCS